ncbi:site-specific integrase [Streptomyces mirabilis]|uniref:site-specific integrase n=1 Tax=Streptomyces mirabilis TaxID=68239 RepID=UPI0036810345
MLVQRVALPTVRVDSWTVLGDDDVPVEPIERYLAYLTDVDRSPNTVRAYAYDLKDYWTFLAHRGLDRTGAPVSFEGVARFAGISRSWLYGQSDIRAEIERLRDATRRSPSPPIPAVERSSDASLHARLEAALERNRHLMEGNQRLRRQLAHALGDQRASARRASTIT